MWWGGLKGCSARGRLETVKDGSQAWTPESGKERAEERGLGRARVEEEDEAAASGNNAKRDLAQARWISNFD